MRPWEGLLGEKHFIILNTVNTVKPKKNTTIKFHENALKLFSLLLKFTNLASEPQKILTYLFMFPECIIQVIHCDYFMGPAMFASRSPVVWFGFFVTR